MAIGTAGYTAMLCVLALERHGVQAGDGEVLVTGATGGVGSVAVALLAQARATRVVGRDRQGGGGGLPAGLGAAQRASTAPSSSAPGKPLQKERWAAVVDRSAATRWPTRCAQTRYGGAVAACGLAQGMDFPATVRPSSCAASRCSASTA